MINLTPTLALLATLTLPVPGFAQSGHNHEQMDHNAPSGSHGPTETGQSAFAALAEIVAILSTDAHTDWDKVNIAALRAHLADMDAVTLQADVVVRDIDRGAVFDVTSIDTKVSGSIRRMVLAHGQTMSEVDGMTIDGIEIEGGARMTVTGPNATMIRALGFFGVMTLGMHHQAHHLALASGSNPHDNH